MPTEPGPSRPERAASSPQKPRIEEITAEGVNGVFSYRVEYNSSSDVSSGLAIIYGENGTGKSTFLHALYHLLTPGRRHALALANSEVSEIRARLTNGATIHYRGDSGSDAQVLTLARQGGDETIEVRISEDITDRSVKDSSRARAYFSALSETTAPVILVSDDRSVVAEGLVDTSNRIPLEYLSIAEFRELSAAGELMGRMRSLEIESAVDRAVATLRRNAMRGLSAGGMNTQSLYVDLVRKLEADRSLLNASDARQNLEVKLRQVERRGESFSRYGLVALDQVQAISHEIAGLRYNAASLGLIQRVVGPYLDSLLLQMDAVESAREFIDAYVSSVNSFIRRKTFKYDLTAGASLVLDSPRRVIPLSALSSGEKHLVLLLSYAVVARELNAVFIIDEPELSLGLDWRRKLVPALLKCADPMHAQFLMASHAVEIVAEYEEQVVNPQEDHFRI